MNRRPTRMTKEEARLALVFIQTVRQQGECAVCGYTGYFVESHHVIAKEKLKRLLRVKGRPCPLEVLWDPRNGLLVCQEPAPNRCHARHTLAVSRIRRSALRPENFEFAHEHELEFVLDAEYPDEDLAAA